MMIVMAMRGGHTRRGVQRLGNKHKQNTQASETYAHKQTFISNYVSVARTDKRTHCKACKRVYGRTDGTFIF